MLVIDSASFAELGANRASLPMEGLSTEERGILGTLRAATRRQEWMAGRLLAKRVLRRHDPHCRGLAFDEITIRSRGVRDEGSQRPHIEAGGRRLPWALSITHCDAIVMVALSDHASVGVDLVPARDLGPAFAACWFTPAERACVAAQPRRLAAAMMWSVKEAVYKAQNSGEPFAPRQIEVHADARGRFFASCGGRLLQGPGTIRVWRLGRQLAALAATVRATRGTFSS